MNMTSNSDVTYIAHQIQMTTICHWMNPPWKFSAYNAALFAFNVRNQGTSERTSPEESFIAQQPVSKKWATCIVKPKNCDEYIVAEYGQAAHFLGRIFVYKSLHSLWVNVTLAGWRWAGNYYWKTFQSLLPTIKNR